jgi:hypothetical protein
MKAKAAIRAKAEKRARKQKKGLLNRKAPHGEKVGEASELRRYRIGYRLTPSALRPQHS